MQVVLKRYPAGLGPARARSCGMKHLFVMLKASFDKDMFTNVNCAAKSGFGPVV